MVLCALSIFGIVVLIAAELAAVPDGLGQFGLHFFYKAYIDPYTHQPIYWDPVNGHFSALPFLYGTLVSSFLALLMAVPLADRRGGLPHRDVPRRPARRRWPFSPSCWPPFPASFTDCGRSSCWCRCCAST